MVMFDIRMMTNGPRINVSYAKIKISSFLFFIQIRFKQTLEKNNKCNS